MTWHELDNLTTAQVVTETHMDDLRENIEHLGNFTADDTALKDHPAGREIGVPAGGILPYGGASAPTGWLLCDGAAVSRTTYARLYAILGTTYGVGDGVNTFNLPDLRGRFPLGKDDMGVGSANRVTDSAADTRGGSGGAETHTLTTAELPAHTHDVAIANASGSGTAAVSGNGTAASDTVSGAASASGSGDAHNNLPPYLTLHYIVKT